MGNLRKRFYQSIAPGGLAGDRQGVVPASGFSFSAEQIWKIIKENRDLDLPAHKVQHYAKLNASSKYYQYTFSGCCSSFSF